MYDRIKQWREFSEQIERHITQYTKPQYGHKAGDEQVDGFSGEDCMKAIERYVNRRHVRLRGDKEALRDMLKIAHYSQFAYEKLKQELGAGDVYE